MASTALGTQGLLAAHERNGAVLLQNAAPTPLSTHEHSRGRFSILTPPGGDFSASVYWSHTKRTALFCCRTWPRPPWAHKPPDGLLAAHERNGAVLLQNAAPTPLSTHEHSRVRFSILTPGQEPQPQRLLEPHEKNGPVLLQKVASTALGTQASGWFIGGTRKERRCFAAECGPDPFEHTRALEGPFFDPNPRTRTAARQSSSGSGNRGRILPRQILFVKCAFYSGPVADLGGTLSQDVASTKSGWGRVYWSHTKRTALFCCRTWPRPPWAHKPPDGLLAAHERNGAVLLQNAAPTPLSTHEHSRVHFSILTPWQGPQP